MFFKLGNYEVVALGLTKGLQPTIMHKKRIVSIIGILYLTYTNIRRK
jgi:hypothetical protein